MDTCISDFYCDIDLNRVIIFDAVADARCKHGLRVIMHRKNKLLMTGIPMESSLTVMLRSHKEG